MEHHEATIQTVDAGRVPASPVALVNYQFLRRSGAWHLVTTNPPVRSCREACAVRWRLGGRGVPLCDELKSNVGAISRDGQREYIVVHCRGHQQLDQAKIEELLQATWARVDESELARFGMEYGTVTPFGFASRADVRQIFDSTVVKRYFPPYTVTTNLGQLTRGVELEPAELIAALPRTEVAAVVADDDARPPREHTLGILTGNSPNSGRLLWSMIDNRVREENNTFFRGDIAFPRVIIESVPGMGQSMELALREPEVRPVVLESVQRLCRNGATVVGIACNTTQYFGSEVAEVCQSYGAQFVSIADATAEYLAQQGITTFDFFGIAAVADFGGYSAFDRLNTEFDLVSPQEADLAAIEQAAFKIKTSGVGNPQDLRNLVRSASDTPTIVVALTELSEVLAEHHLKGVDKTFIDTLAILSQAMAGIYLRERLVARAPRSASKQDVPSA